MMRDFKQYLEIVRHHIVSALSKIGYLFFFWSESRRFVFPAFARRGIFIFTFRAKREDFYSYFSREARRKNSNLGTAASKAINV